MRLLFLFSPLLLATYPVLRMFAANMNKLVPSALIVPLGIAAGIGVGLCLVCSLFYRNVQRGIFLTGLMLLTSVVLGPLLVRGESSLVGTYILNEGAYYFVALGALLFCWLGWRVRRWPYLREGNQVLVVVAVALTLGPAIQVGSYLYRHQGFIAVRKPQAIAPGDAAGAAGRPDIYYIILDGYGRDDVLRERYHYDNSAFTGFLKSRGFYVADKSRSNYPYTFLSLGSALNMAHMTDLNRHPDQEALGTERVRQNAVMKELKQRGYTIAHLSSGWVVTGQDLPLADYNFSYRSLNEFGVGVLDSTLARFFVRPDFYVASQREVVNYQLGKLRDISAMKQPTFAFAHIVCPHPPFVFDRQGGTPARTSKFKHLEADWLPQERYVDQLAYLNGRVEQLVDHILRASRTPPVIILQSDHGPACPGMEARAAREVIWQRTSILNAYYAPESVKAHLYPGITPVNSFRVIFNGIFGKSLPMVPDNSYYAGPIGLMPYTFIDVTRLPAK